MGFGFTRRTRRANDTRAPIRGLPRDVLSWPLRDCRIESRWRTPPALATVVASRSNGRATAVAAFLLDLGCLGAKDAVLATVPDADYPAFTRGLLHGAHEACDLAFASRIVHAAIAFADGLGFRPHPHAHAALPFLGPDAGCRTHVHLGGPDGRPFYIQGPHDPPDVLERLLRRLGPGGFQFIVVDPLDDMAPPRRRDTRRTPDDWFEVDD